MSHTPRAPLFLQVGVPLSETTTPELAGDTNSTPLGHLALPTAPAASMLWAGMGTAQRRTKEGREGIRAGLLDTRWFGFHQPLELQHD